MPAVLGFLPLLALEAAGPLLSKALAPKGPSGPSEDDLKKQAAEAEAKQKAQEDVRTKEAILHQAPSIQAQLGGAVAPEYYIAESAREAGAAGEENLARQALSGFLGLSSAGDTSHGATSVASVPGAAPTPATVGGDRSNVFETILSQYFPGGTGGVGGGGQSSTGTSGGYV